MLSHRVERLTNPGYNAVHQVFESRASWCSDAKLTPQTRRGAEKSQIFDFSTKKLRRTVPETAAKMVMFASPQRGKGEHMERIVLIIVGALVFAGWLYAYEYVGQDAAHGATHQAAMLLTTILAAAMTCKCRTTNGEGR
jgi:hypothetical protein